MTQIFEKVTDELIKRITAEMAQRQYNDDKIMVKTVITRAVNNNQCEPCIRIETDNLSRRCCEELFQELRQKLSRFECRPKFDENKKMVEIFICEKND